MSSPLPPEARPPEVISHYRLAKLLGSGGMGSVYQAVDRRDDSTVAVKLLHSHLEDDETYRERFEREAHVAALLRSPYTVHLLGYGFAERRYFIVMEYVEGQTLKQALQSGPIEPRRALRIAAQVARALEEAEARGVVHRDIKPDNILLGAGESVKVSDFGIARQVGSATLTMPGAFVGTLAYAAPELALGKVDHRSDIYSLGATLYHMLTGRRPFGGGPLEMLRHHAETPLPVEPLADLPPAVVELVKRCLEKDPAQRYQSASALAGALEHAVHAVPTPEPEAPTEVLETAPTQVPETAPTEVPPTAPVAETELPPTEVKPPEQPPAPAAPLLTLQLGPPRAGGPFGARLSSTCYDLTIRNGGDERLALHLEAQDNEGRCAFSLPASVSVAPHETARVTLKARPRQRRWGGDPRTRTFVVSASPGGGQPPVTVSGQFEDLPYGWLRYAGGAMLMGALVAILLSAFVVLAGGGGGESLSGTIAFVSSRDTNDEIYVMNADGSGLTRLTENPASDMAPSWSPDGSRIAFVSQRAGDLEIYSMNADGSDPSRLTNSSGADLDPAWAPSDAAHLAFESARDGDFDIYVLNLETSEVTQLTSDPGIDRRPTWSPDGLRIAFESVRDGNFNIYVINADGSGLTRLTTDPADDTAPAWSPDGNRIAFSSNRDGDYEIYTMNRDGTAVTNVTANDHSDSSPCWSPDGQHLAFVSDRDGNSEIYVMGSDGSNSTRLTNDPGDDRDPAWSSSALSVEETPEADTPTAIATPSVTPTATSVPEPTPTPTPTPTAEPPSDRDNDTVPDDSDNCPDTHNPDQANTYGDARGDACESPPDRDSDTVPDDSDNCPDAYNPKQENTYGDARGDACESPPDRDSDTVPDSSDNCPDAYNPDQADTYGDARGDACEPLPDRDSDTVPDASDNCPDAYNPDQADTYGDARGDACEPPPGPPPLSIETGPWVFYFMAVENTCEFGPFPGDTETETLYFDEIDIGDGYISDGELAAVFDADGFYLGDAILDWPDMYFEYYVDPDWSISYLIEFANANEYYIADKVEFFSDVICGILWEG